jgi:NAD+ synthase (glutamine-hydrolysing)
MKIFLSQQNYHIGNFEYNTAQIIKAIRQANMDGGDLIVFSELSICGYPPRDFLYFKYFIEKCEKAIEEIAK